MCSILATSLSCEKWFPTPDTFAVFLSSKADPSCVTLDLSLLFELIQDDSSWNVYRQTCIKQGKMNTKYEMGVIAILLNIQQTYQDTTNQTTCYEERMRFVLDIASTFFQDTLFHMTKEFSQSMALQLATIFDDSDSVYHACRDYLQQVTNTMCAAFRTLFASVSTGSFSCISTMIELYLQQRSTLLQLGKKMISYCQQYIQTQKNMLHSFHFQSEEEKEVCQTFLSDTNKAMLHHAHLCSVLSQPSLSKEDLPLIHAFDTTKQSRLFPLKKEDFFRAVSYLPPQVVSSAVKKQLVIVEIQKDQEAIQLHSSIQSMNIKTLCSRRKTKA